MNKALTFLRAMESARPNLEQSELLDSLAFCLSTEQIALAEALEVAWLSGVQQGRVEELRAIDARITKKQEAA